MPISPPGVYPEMDVPGAGAAPLPFINGEDPIYTILGDTDVALQALLNAVPAGGALIFLGSRNYAINNQLVFAQANTYIFGNGESTVLTCNTAPAAPIFTNVNNCTMENLAVTSAVAPLRIFQPDGVTGFTLRDVRVTHGGNVETIEDTPGASTDVVIERCVIQRTGTAGTTIRANGNHWTIRNNIFTLETANIANCIRSSMAIISGNVVREIGAVNFTGNTFAMLANNIVTGNVLQCNRTTTAISLAVNQNLVAGNMVIAQLNFLEIGANRTQNLVVGNVSDERVLTPATSHENGFHGNRVEVMQVQPDNTYSANVVG